MVANGLRITSKSSTGVVRVKDYGALPSGGTRHGSTAVKYLLTFGNREPRAPFLDTNLRAKKVLVCFPRGAPCRFPVQGGFGASQDFFCDGGSEGLRDP